MKIQAISNSSINQKSKSNTAFTGEFEMNDEIKTFVNLSKYEHMARFRDLLVKMKKKNDDYVYVLEKKTYVNEVEPNFSWNWDEEDTVKIETGFELSRYKKGNPTEKKWIAGFEDDGFYRNKLGELNERLEDEYPVRAGKITRGKTSKEIFDMMI